MPAVQHILFLFLLPFSVLYGGNGSTVSTASSVIPSHFSLLLAY